MTTDMGKMAPPPSPAPSSSLAVVAERRLPHRPGGCTGVLFQLFDWNHHRLASKKLFSRRLLPQARAAKRISKKFAADERMPPAKLLLIADENRGSFPSSKRADAGGSTAGNDDRGKRMCSPSLVARLMGLDSMPSADGHGRPRKAEDGASCSSSSEGGGGGGGSCYFDGSDTSCSSRYCQDPGFEIAGGGGGRRPPKQQKTGFFDRLPATNAGASPEAALMFNRNLLARPRKSHPKPPPSPIKSPRLAGRTSSALLMEAAARILEPKMQQSRRPSLTFPLPYQATPESTQSSSSPLERPNELVGAPSLRPCGNCGNQDGAPEEVPGASETSVVESAPSSTSSDLSQTSSAAPRPPIFPKKEIARRNSMERKRTPQLNEPQVPSKPRRVAAVSRSTTPRQSTARPNELPSAGAKAASPPKPDVRQRARRVDLPSPSESRENLRNFPRDRAARSTGGERTEIERSSACEKKPLARKRRSAGSTIQREEGAPPKQRSTAAGGAHKPRGSSRRRKTMEARDGGGDEAATASGSLAEETSCGPVRNPDGTVDALSALLEQKIRELSDLGRDESVAGILEELISALTSAQTETQRRDYGAPSDLRTGGGTDYGRRSLPECRRCQGPNLCVIEDFQVVQEYGPSPESLHSTDYDQPSPVSILEASFSNDGSFSEKSFRSSSGHRLPMRFPENLDKSSSLEFPAELSDSGISTIAGGTEPGSPPPPPTQFRDVGPRVVQSAGSKSNYVGELFSEADLLFGGAILHDALESLVEALREGEGQLSGGGDSEQEFKLRRLLFDCILEHVDVNYGDHGGAGYRARGKKLRRPASQMLAREVREEMEACRSMAGKGLDEVVGSDMGRMNGWWVDSDAEAFGAGAEIGNHLLQLLVDEVAFDLLLR